ncbi:50S ribosomal protein L21, partial [Patescibacteria group bacterium]|nr:50S ribosomal protein L21 [Patescibacteria group bacterium]
MFAVIRTGGKQYLVSPGDKIKIEKLDVGEKKEIVFDEVLLVVSD